MNTLPTVFITAAGRSTRFNGNIKQLLPIHGEPLIRRTIRQIKEFNPGIQINIITWKQELIFSDVNTIITPGSPPQLSDTILLSLPWWNDRNVFLLGDVVYETATLQKILNYQNGSAIFARKNCINKPHHERFAFIIHGNDIIKIKNILIKASKIFENSKEEIKNSGGLIKICHATKPTPIILLLSPITINHISFKHLRPIRDYFLYHIYKNFWYPWKPIKLELISDKFTTDIDTPEDYKEFFNKGGYFCDR